MAKTSKPKIVIVDANDKIIGYKNGDTLNKDDIYRVSALWITNSDGQILLARRHHTKSHHPRKWGSAVAGTVEEGETYEKNIIKEAEEELGLENIKPKIGPKTKTDNEYHHFTQCFLLNVDLDITQFKIQEDEVEEIKWFFPEELKKQLQENPEEFLPTMKKYFELFSPRSNCELANTTNMIDKKLLAKIRKLADSPNWGVREDATKDIKAINDKFFFEYLPIWKKWVAEPNPNIRRAIEVGLLRIKKEFIPHALDLLDPLMYDDDAYVRKNCGPFALSHVGYKDPDTTFKRLRKWMKVKNKNVRWNVAMCLGVWFGQSYPKGSLKLLKVLAKDQEKFVWRAVASSLVKLIRKHPKLKQEVFLWKGCDDCLAVVKHYVK